MNQSHNKNLIMIEVDFWRRATGSSRIERLGNIDIRSRRDNFNYQW